MLMYYGTPNNPIQNIHQSKIEVAVHPLHTAANYYWYKQ